MARKIYKLPNDYLSHSQIETYQKCPKAYEFQYIVKPEGIGTSEALLVGSAMHKQMAKLLVAKSNPRSTFNLTEAKKLLTQELGDTLGTLAAVRPASPPNVTQEIQVAVALLEEWHSQIYRHFHTQPDMVEKKIELEIGGYPFVGFIDAIDITSNHEVIDWKVTSMAKTQADANNSLQLSIYSMATRYPNVGFVSLVKPRANSKNWKPSVVKVSSTRSKHQLEWAEYLVSKVAEGIGKKIFPPCSPTAFNCSEKYCNFWHLCRGKSDVEFRSMISSWIE